MTEGKIKGGVIPKSNLNPIKQPPTPTPSGEKYVRCTDCDISVNLEVIKDAIHFINIYDLSSKYGICE